MKEVSKISNKYSFIERLRLGIWLIRTKLISRKARIIRFPFHLRGKQFVVFNTGFTTGYNCRIEAFAPNNSQSDKKIIFGKNVQINDNVHISAIEKVEIGDNVLMASNIYISDNSHGSYKGDSFDTSPEIIPIERPYYVSPIKIGSRSWIGEGVIILPGVTIGEGCIIGAHSVVNKDIPNNSIVVGSPAKVIKIWDRETKKWAKAALSRSTQ